MYRRMQKEHKTYKTQTEQTVIIGGETDYCAERFGFRSDKNGITPSLVYEQLNPVKSFSNVVFADYLPSYGIAAFASRTGLIAVWNPTEQSAVTNAGIASTNYPKVHACVDNGDNIYAVFTGSGVLKITSSGSTKTSSLPVTILGTARHCGRIFGVDATDKYKIRWSGYAINDWTVGADRSGSVNLDLGLGKALNLFELGEKIAIVRDCGITMLSTLGDFRHMRIDIGDKYRLPAVYENASAICGGKLWIYTKSGMYVFDGSAVSEAPFDERMTGYTLVKPIVVEDRYIYYSATMESGGSCIFEYDTQTGECTPFARGCVCPFFVDKSDGYCFSGKYIGKLINGGDDAYRVWVSRPVTFGAGKTGLLKSVTVEGSGQFTVEIDCDGRKLYATQAGKTNFAEFAESCTFKVTGNGSITSMTAEWEVR